MGESSSPARSGDKRNVAPRERRTMPKSAHSAAAARLEPSGASCSHLVRRISARRRERREGGSVSSLVDRDGGASSSPADRAFASNVCADHAEP